MIVGIHRETFYAKERYVGKQIARIHRQVLGPFEMIAEEIEYINLKDFSLVWYERQRNGLFSS